MHAFVGGILTLLNRADDFMNLFYCYTILAVEGLLPLPDTKVESHNGLLKFSLCGAFSDMRCVWRLYEIKVKVNSVSQNRKH